MSKRFGIRMDGNELEIESLIRDYLKNIDSFNFLEIGSAAGKTLKAIYEIIQESVSHHDWEVNGLDILNGWSLDMKAIEQFGHPISIIYNNQLPNHLEKARLFLQDDPRQWIKNLQNSSIDICFIDGCHCSNCPADDFLSVDRKIKRGGYVIFHDTCILSQGTDWQMHGNSFIDVRNSIQKIGLLDNKYPNWTLYKELLGTRFSGGEGNGCVIINKK
jgi:SAM-dependent methyltransferase